MVTSTGVDATQEPLMTPRGPMNYRSVNQGHDDLESLIGDSASGEGSERSGRKIPSILGKAWRRSVEWQNARKSGKSAPRLVDREGSYHQSYGRWNIRRLKDLPETKKLVQSDPFHSMVNLSTFKIILGMLALYIAIVFIFSVVYWTISHFLGCHLDLPSLREAFLFSLETMSTVGYGTSDYLFDNCLIMLPVLALQACMGLLIDAFLIGILFVRLSRPQTRASTVVFSNEAVIRRVRGESYFMFQVGELRKHQLLEVKVRCYALRHERITQFPAEQCAKLRASGNGRVEETFAVDSSVEQQDEVFFQCHNMRLQHPDDELGGNLLLVVPQTVVHRIDAWSPMMPPPRWNSTHGVVQWGLHPDREMTKMPWEECDDDESSVNGRVQLNLGGSGSGRLAIPADGENSAGSVIFDGSQKGLPGARDVDLRSHLTRNDSRYKKYWDERAISECGAGGSERRASGVNDSVGYVHRFPDLLKRWDDVDGDRGTWYEVMKRRMVRVEAERRREEDLRAKKSSAETNNAGKNWRKVAGRRRSIMQIGADARSNESTSERQRVQSPPDGLSFSSGNRKEIVKKRHEKIFGKTQKEFSRRISEIEEGKLSGSSNQCGSLESARAPVADISATATDVGGFIRENSISTLSAAQWFAREERKAIDAFVQDRELEVVVILEGTDTATGSTVQARHSYCRENIKWNRTYARCVTRDDKGTCVIDFSKFHNTVYAPEDCFDPGFVQSYA